MRFSYLWIFNSNQFLILFFWHSFCILIIKTKYSGGIELKNARIIEKIEKMGISKYDLGFIMITCSLIAIIIAGLIV